MSGRRAQCNCGQLVATCTEELLGSLCVIAWLANDLPEGLSDNARFAEGDVSVIGDRAHLPESARRPVGPRLQVLSGLWTTLLYRSENDSGTMVSPPGTFTDITFPPATRSLPSTPPCMGCEISASPLERIDWASLM